VGAAKRAGQNRFQREPFGRNARLSSGFWNENALARLRGEKPASPGNNEETFNDFDAAHWDQIVQRLDRVMKDLEAVVEKMPEEKLALKAPLISHISTHNAYHTGQILYVRKLQGSWNPENGVK
jgi:uncharacterized damage-inducible protein DinB